MKGRFFAALVLVSLLTGCYAHLNMSPRQVSRVKNDEGVVLGSFKFSDNKGWNIETKGPYEYNAEKNQYIPAKGFQAILFRTKGHETPYVCRLPAGHYLIYNIYCQGMVGKRRVPSGYMFEVLPQQTVYVGQLNFDLVKVKPSLARQSLRRDIDRFGTVTLNTGIVYADTVNKFDDFFDLVSDDYKINKEDVVVKLLN